MMNLLKKLLFYGMFLFYLLAGINHFIHPDFYIAIIPPYLPLQHILNYLVGFFEIAFAILLIPIKTRKYAAYGIILMLLAFLPVHIYIIEAANQSNLMLGNFVITPFIAWVRIPFQGIFIYWAYWCTKIKF